MKQFREVKIIKQESEAKTRSSMNILPVGNGLCKLIFIDECGEKIVNSANLPDNIATYDYDLHDQVMMKDGTTKESTDLGKNVANSKPTSIAGAGLILGSPWEINTGGQPMTVTGLPDKSADITFDRLKVQNAAGNEAVVSNMYNLLYKGLTGLTAQQATNISYLLNGGIGSDGMMSINNISPPIIQNRFDSIEYVLLRGLNLNLSAVGRKVEILASNRSTVVLTIPDSQIQTNPSGLELVFAHNFFNFPTGEYFIRITSGVKQYIADLSLKIVQEVENINTNAITWSFFFDESITPNPSNVASGSGFTIVAPQGATGTPRISLKSGEIFAEGEDFYIEIKITVGYVNVGGDAAISDIGIGYSNSVNNLNRSTLVRYGYSFSGNDNIRSFNNSTPVNVESSPINRTVIFIKTGNLFRTIVGGVSVTETFSNNSGYAIFAQIVGREPASHTIQCQILKAFKFN